MQSPQQVNSTIRQMQQLPKISSSAQNIRNHQEEICDATIRKIHKIFFDENERNRKILDKGSSIDGPTVSATFSYKEGKRSYTISPASILDTIDKNLETATVFFNTKEFEGLFDTTVVNVIAKMDKSLYSHLMKLIADTEGLNPNQLLDDLKKSKILRHATYIFVEEYAKRA